MMVVLLVVIVFSGVFIVYGSGYVNEKRDFYSNFSQSFRSNRITFGYNIGHNTMKGDLLFITFANGYIDYRGASTTPDVYTYEVTR